MDDTTSTPPSKKRKARAKAKPAAAAAAKVAGKPPKKPKPPARRERYPGRTEALEQAILERLRDGESLTSICETKGMPHERLVRMWAAESTPFADQYRRARAIGYMKMADEIIAIADTGSGDPHRDRLRCDMRRWMLSKCLPRIFGDKIEVESTENVVVSEQGTPATNEFIRRLEQLARRQQQGFGRVEDGISLAATTILPPDPPSKDIVKAANAGPFEPAMDDSKLVDVTPRPPFEFRGVESPAEGRPVQERSRAACTNEFTQLRCSSERPEVLDRHRYARPHVVANDHFGRSRRRTD